MPANPCATTPVSLAQTVVVWANRASQTSWRAAIFPSVLADPAVLLPFIAIGFAAQMVDGALGMAFGQISSTLLVSMGVPPAAASAGVHTAETFTTGGVGDQPRRAPQCRLAAVRPDRDPGRDRRRDWALMC